MSIIAAETADLSGGTIDYADTRGSGPVVMLLHGLVMDASLSDAVVGHLGRDHPASSRRCRWAHRRPVRDGADLSLAGLDGFVDKLLERLDLRDHTGGA